MNEEKDQYVALTFDEIKLREDHVFDKHFCKLICFVRCWNDQ